MSTVLQEPIAPSINPEPLLHLLIGFEASQVLMTANAAGVFQILANGKALTTTELSQGLGLSLQGGERLFQTCTALGLLEFRDTCFCNSNLTETYLVPGKKLFLGKLLEFYRESIYTVWAGLPQAVRQARPQMGLTELPGSDFFALMEKQKAMTLHFLEALHNLGNLEGEQLAQLYSFELVNHVLDVGCGSGALGMALAHAYPHLQVTLFDRPWVCEIAQGKVAAEALQDRVHVTPGDFLHAPLPPGADMVLLSMVLHDWDKPTGIQILKRCWEALPSGGTVLIYEQLLNEDRCGPPLTTLTGLTMLLTLSGGTEYSETDYESMLTEADFVNIRITRSSGLRHVISAKKS